MIRSLLLAACQIIWTWPVLVAIYMLLAVLDFQGGIDGLVGLVVFQPLIGCILASLTVVLCLAAGLPIRLVKRLNAWWKNHFIFTLAGLLLALLSFAAANVPRWKETVHVWIDGEKTDATMQIPNMWLLGAGWLLAAFFLLHLQPPLRWPWKKLF